MEKNSSPSLDCSQPKDKEQTHRLLKQQLKRCFGDDFVVPEAWEDFIHMVNHTYHQLNLDEIDTLSEKNLELDSPKLLGIAPPAQNLIQNKELQLVQPSSELDKALRNLQQEISERASTEIALRESEQRFRAIFAGAAIGIALSNVDGLIVEANPAKETMLGYSAAELRNLHFSDYTHPEDCQKDLDLYQNLFAGKRNYYQIEKRYLRKNGQVVWGRLTVSLIYNEELKPMFAVRMMEDINDRKLVEKSLKLRDQAIAASSSGIVLVDCTLPSNPMIYVNPAFERITGYSASEAVGKNCRFLQGTETNQKGLNELRSAIQSGRDCKVVLRNYRKDGSLFWNELSISPIHDAAGNLTHFVGIQTDISDRKQAEAKLKETIQREQLSNQLANQIRHTLDLDTILKTAVTEIQSLLDIDRCVFAWCLPDEEYPFWEIVKEARLPELPTMIGHYPGTNFGKLTEKIINLEIEQIDDVSILDDRDLLAAMQSFDSVSVLAIPIKSNSDAIGVIWCHNCHFRPWGDSEVKLLQSVAAQLAIAIDQAELYEQSQISVTYAQAQAQKLEQINLELQSQIQERRRIEQSLREQETRLRKQNQALAKLTKAKTLYCENFSDALHEITETATRILDVGRSSIWLYNEDHTKLTCCNLYERNFNRHSSGIEISSVDFPAHFQALLEERSFVVYDAQNDPRTNELATGYLIPLGITSVLEASIWLAGEMVGVICNEHIGTYRQWALEEENFANSLADFVSLVMEVQDRKRAESALRQSETQLKQKAQELEITLVDLKRTQSQLIQTEKMSSLGQLVAGVAHEINNPVNFIYGNIGHTGRYAEDLLEILDLYQKHYPEPVPEIQNRMHLIDIGFLVKDFPKILSSMKMGSERIRQIVLSLRNFSRLDEADMKPVDIHEGIDSTLLILQHRIKTVDRSPSLEVVKNYGDLPLVECYAGQLNQVFMNIISNAIDTLETSAIASPRIEICTEISELDRVIIRIIDNGPGMSETIRQRLFDPFFTTKPVGQGTGLGLSISYHIVVDKHKGKLDCISSPSKGAEFAIEIPIQQRSVEN